MNTHRPLPDVSQTVRCYTAAKEMDLSPHQRQAQHTYHAAFYAFQAAPDDPDARRADFVAIWKACFTAAGDTTLYDEHIAPASLDQPITFRGQTKPKWWWWLSKRFVSDLQCSSDWKASELQDLYQKLHSELMYPSQSCSTVAEADNIARFDLGQTLPISTSSIFQRRRAGHLDGKLQLSSSAESSWGEELMMTTLTHPFRLSFTKADFLTRAASYKSGEATSSPTACNSRRPSASPDPS